MKLYKSLLAASIFLLCFSCKKNSNEPNTDYDTTTVTYGLQGYITDENNRPVEGAEVTSAAGVVHTNASGKFIYNKITSVVENAYVTVKKDGYFEGSRSFIPEADQVHSIKIKLLKRDTYKTINAISGGQASFASGIKLDFPGNAFETLTGTAYTGVVNVYTAYIDPTADDFTEIMPGDLRGLDETGNKVSLISFGMLKVELETSSGEPLQVASGKQVKMTSPIQNIQQSKAPASIPLFYWEKATGLWQLQGEATKNGNEYSGYVTHFTDWNYDLYTPNWSTVKAKFVTPSGNPVAFKRVDIIPVDANFDFPGASSSTGKINIAVPLWPTQMLLIMKDDCGQVLYSSNIGMVTGPLDLGTIVVTNIVPTLTITGRITDCSGAPLGNAKVFIEMLGRFEGMQALPDGSFNMELLGCLSAVEFKVYASSSTGGELQVPVTVQVNARTSIDVGDIAVCNDAGDEFIRIIRDNDTLDYRFPEATSIFGDVIRPDYTKDSSRTNIFALVPGEAVYQGLILNHAPFDFTAPGTMKLYVISHGLNGVIYSYAPVTPNIQGLPVTDPTVNITEYGPVGGYIAGNFTGRCYRELYYALDNNYMFKVTFRVKRRQ